MTMGDPAEQSRAGAPPAVSVVTAVLNCERFIAESVDSILNQTLRDLELIVVDDGSTDGTSEILADYARRDPRVRLIHRERAGGAATARNAGIEIARADLLAFQDADDVSVPDRLERHKAHLGARPDIGFVTSPPLRVDVDDNPIAVKRIPYRGAELIERMQHYCYLSHCSAMYRTRVVREIGGYRAGLAGAEDYDLLLRLIEKTRFDVVDYSVYHHRQVPTGITYSGSDALRKSSELVRRFARQRAETGRDDYEASVRADRMPSLPAAPRPVDFALYYHRLARAALDCGAYRPTLKFVWRGLCARPARAPKFACLTAAAAARFVLQLTGALDWFERTFRGR